MSSLCSNPEIEYAVGDALRELSRQYPALRVTASGIARIARTTDVAMVQNALIDAANKKLLTPSLRYRCSVCGSLNDYIGAPALGLECIEDGEIEHDIVAMYDFTTALHDIAEKSVPKKKARRHKSPLPSWIKAQSDKLGALVQEMRRTRNKDLN